MKNLEDQVQFACCQWLRAEKIAFFHVPNGGLRSKSEAARLTALGVTPGVPDLVILFPGAVTVFVELKTRKGTPSKLQKLYHEKLLKMGFHILLLKNDDAAAAVRDLQAFLAAFRHLPETLTV